MFSPQQSFVGAVPVRVPCGRCVGCRLDRGRQWGIRIMHEVKIAGFGRSHFATLTFSPEGLAAVEAADPERPRSSVSKRDVQLFMKRLRKRVGDGVKAFTGAEYGGKRLRPHYHVCLMHLDLEGLMPWRKSRSGHVLYRSRLLEELWPFGHVEVGALTQQSAEYTARYCMKKVSAELAVERYRRVDAATGETWQVEPEFGLMSKGIGAAFFERYERDFASGYLIVDGHKAPIPRYYRLRMAGALQQKLTVQGKANARKQAHDNHDGRLLTKHAVRELKAERLVRQLDAGADDAAGHVEPVGLVKPRDDDAWALFGLMTEEERAERMRKLLKGGSR